MTPWSLGCQMDVVLEGMKNNIRLFALIYLHQSDQVHWQWAVGFWKYILHNC